MQRQGRKVYKVGIRPFSQWRRQREENPLYLIMPQSQLIYKWTHVSTHNDSVHWIVTPMSSEKKVKSPKKAMNSLRNAHAFHYFPLLSISCTARRCGEEKKFKSIALIRSSVGAKCIVYYTISTLLLTDNMFFVTSLSATLSHTVPI